MAGVSKGAKEAKSWRLKAALHNAYIEQFGASVYKIQPYIIPSNILLLSIIYG